MKNIMKLHENHTEYLHDESRIRGFADQIVFPHTEDNIKSIINYCLQNDITITIQGSRTGITGGCVPQGGLIMNLERMKYITGIRRDQQSNYFLRCQPGLTLKDLREILSKKLYNTTDWSPQEQALWQEFTRSGDYMFPPDPTEITASLGGMASCNASGALSYKYGSIRNWISNLKVTGINGSSSLPKNFIGKFEPLAIKNASGYYLSSNNRDFDHFIGAEGTLAVISELELRLIKKPACRSGLMQFFASENQAMQFTKIIKAASTQPCAIEYFDDNSLDLLRARRELWQELPVMKYNWSFAIYCEYEGDNEAEIEQAVFFAGDSALECGARDTDCWLVDSTAAIEQLKKFRHALPEAINEELDQIRQNDFRIAKLSSDLAVPENMLPEILNFYHQFQKMGWRIFIFGHIGDNHLHTNIIPHNYPEYIKAKKIIESWAKAAVKMGGTVSAEHGIGKIKKPLLYLMYDPEKINVYTELKNYYDPHWLLNRGNLIDIK